MLGPTEPNPRINLSLAGLGVINTVVEDGPNKVFVGGLPTYLTEDQVRAWAGQGAAGQSNTTVSVKMMRWPKKGFVSGLLTYLTEEQVRGRGKAIARWREEKQQVHALSAVPPLMA